jgi:hypothetical protein
MVDRRDKARDEAFVCANRMDHSKSIQLRDQHCIQEKTTLSKVWSWNRKKISSIRQAADGRWPSKLIYAISCPAVIV